MTDRGGATGGAGPGVRPSPYHLQKMRRKRGKRRRKRKEKKKKEGEEEKGRRRRRVLQHLPTIFQF